MQGFVDMLKKKLFFFVLALLFSFVTYSQTIDSLRGVLHEVEVTTKYNPAIPIIKKTIQNRNKNGQFANDHFISTSYQKMIFTGDMNRDSVRLIKAWQRIDSLKSDSVAFSKKDSAFLSTVDFFEKSHLFLVETVTKNYYKKPATHYEKVIAHHTAGMKDPIISIFIAKQQAVNFYQKDNLEIFGSSFASPISKTSFTVYDFRLEGILIRETDTLFVVSFKPHKNALFKSLTGKIWITSENYAFTKIEVVPYDKTFGFSFILRQEYEKQPNRTYFLKDMFLEVELLFMRVSPKGGGAFVRPVIRSEKRISDIDYETRFRNHEIGLVNIEESLENEGKQKEILSAYRAEHLSDKELKTYTVVDSLMAPFKADKKMEALKILSTGRIPFSVISLDLAQILQFNSTENVRLGLGIYTNNRLSKVVNFGGFFGYGFKDKSWKWGGELGWNILRNRGFKLNLKYSSNLVESGETEYFDRNLTLFSSDYARSWLYKRFYRSDAYGAVLQSKLTRWLTGYISSFYSQNKTIFDYDYQTISLDETAPKFSFKDFYVKAGVKLAFGESSWSADNYIFRSVSPYPVVTVQYTRGLKGVINSDFNYNRIDLRVNYRKNWKILGFTNLALYAGYIDRSLPYPLLYNQRASFFYIGLVNVELFSTMRPGEFLSDKYVSLHIRHNFGRMTKNKKFSPRIVVSQGIGFGGLKNPENHVGIDFKSMEKGYFESGVIIEDIWVIKRMFSLGAGVFVRYGPYYLHKLQHKPIDNFAFKVSLGIPTGR